MSGLFSAADLAAMAGGIMRQAPVGYKLPEKFPSFSGHKYLALDLEAHDPTIADSGPGWRRGAFICGFSIALANDLKKIDYSEYYPIRHRSTQNLDAERILSWLYDEVAFFDGEIVGANLLYDGDGLQASGIIAPFAKWRDVQWAEALIDENALNYKLGSLGLKYLGQSKVTEELKHLYGPDYIKRFEEVHPGHARDYGLGDVRLPLGIYAAQILELEKQGLTELFDIESRLMPMLLHMRQHGTRVNTEAARIIGLQLAEKRDKCLREASRMLGTTINSENMGQVDVLKNALERLGAEVPVTKKNKQGKGGGKPSITDQWLIDLEKTKGLRVGPILAQARKYNKAKTTFVDGYIDGCAIDGRVHCEFHPLRKTDEEGTSKGTVSGRFSSTNPNLQNIPARDEELGPLLRALFLPDEGWDWFSADYSQIEYRLIVNFAAAHKVKGWEVPVKAYCENPDTDFHQMVAELTGKPRKQAKNINFGMAFCMGAFHLAEVLGLVVVNSETGRLEASPEAKKILNEYHERVPFVKGSSTLATKLAQDTGFTSTILGRRSRFELWEPKRYGDSGRMTPLPHKQALAAYGNSIQRAMTHKALNRYTQGSGADILKSAMVKIWESGLMDDDSGLRINLTVHDELDGSVEPSDRGKASLKEMVHIMESTIKLALPVMVDCKTGANWSETH